MRTRNVTVQEGEYLGPFDESFDFEKERAGSSYNPDCLLECEKRIRRLASVPKEELGDWYATTDGGWPRVGWHQVMLVGMYDGWPYWKSKPAVSTLGPLGAEWHFFHSITNIRNRKTGEEL